jgi:hypothetical protein
MKKGKVRSIFMLVFIFLSISAFSEFLRHMELAVPLGASLEAVMKIYNRSISGDMEEIVLEKSPQDVRVFVQYGGRRVFYFYQNKLYKFFFSTLEGGIGGGYGLSSYVLKDLTNEYGAFDNISEETSSDGSKHYEFINYHSRNLFIVVKVKATIGYYKKNNQYEFFVEDYFSVIYFDPIIDVLLGEFHVDEIFYLHN